MMAQLLNSLHFVADARVLFKDIVNTIADVTQEGNTKFIVLKPNFYFTPDHQPKRRPESLLLSSDGFQSIPRGQPIFNPSIAQPQPVPVHIAADRRRVHPIPVEISQGASRPRVQMPPNIPLTHHQMPSDTMMVTAVPYNIGYTQHIPALNSVWNPSEVAPQPPPRRRSSTSGPLTVSYGPPISTQNLYSDERTNSRKIVPVDQKVSIKLMESMHDIEPC